LRSISAFKIPITEQSSGQDKENRVMAAALAHKVSMDKEYY